MNKIIDKAYDEGCEAAAEVFANRSACPYALNTAEWVAWTMGFDTVRYDIENPRD